MKTNRLAVVLLLALLFTPDLWAALPTPTMPSTAPGTDDWLSIIKGYIKDGGVIIGPALDR